MKSRGFTLIELMVVVAILGILFAIAIPNFLQFQCRAQGNELGLNIDLVRAVCSDCTGCSEEGVTSQEAMQMIADGADPSRFVEWQSEKPTIVPKPEPAANIIEAPVENPTGMPTNDLPEPVRRSWKE